MNNCYIREEIGTKDRDKESLPLFILFFIDYLVLPYLAFVLVALLLDIY